MLQEIEGLPAGAIGVVAHGQITLSEQRAILEPTIASARAASRSGVKLLYVAAPDFAGYERGRLFDEAVFGTRHFADFAKVAFVADEGPYDRAVHALEGLMPGEIRVFPGRALEEAKAWLAK